MATRAVPGMQLGDFRLVRPLAEGGMGVVYVADQVSTGRQRAVKVMHDGLLADARLRERFEQEARIVGRIQSDHVVEVVAAGVDTASQLPWLAMELLEGEDLAARMMRTGAIPIDEARLVLGQLCHALAAAHRVGVVHRDLKPENVFLAQPRQQHLRVMVKVLDFGIAKVVAEARATSSATASMGTPRWMAPEQCEAAGLIRPATDVWALGLIAFYVLTGRYFWRYATPETGGSVMTLMREVLFEPIVGASSRAMELGVQTPLPPGFDAWFGRCVARLPEGRFADGAQAGEALDAVLRPQPSAVSGGIPQPPPYIAPGFSGAAFQSPVAEIAAVGRTLPQPLQPIRRTSLAIPLAIAALVLVLGSAAAAFVVWHRLRGGERHLGARPELAGQWTITGAQNPSGVSYSGGLRLARLGENYRANWSVGAGASYNGVGILADDRLVVAWSNQPHYGVAAYRIDGGRLHGRWAGIERPAILAFEELVGPETLSGTYTITRATGGYQGTVNIQPTGETFALTWNVGGSSYRGVGIRQDDVLAVAWVPTGQVGVVVYEVDGGSLAGRWAGLGDTRLGSESLTRR